MRPPERTTLLITPSVAGRALPDGRWELSRKFVAGAAAFAERWPGRVQVLMRPRDEDDENLDNEPYAPVDFPFDLECSPYAPDRLLRDDVRSSLVLGVIDYPQREMLRRAAAAGVYVVAITETTLRTRLQILRSETPNRLRAARRALWHWNYERHSRALLRLCRGIQCNGTPTFGRYRKLCPRTMLFYDNRMDAASIPSRDRLERRLAALRQGGPLRLAFSGRLARLKGVHHLPDLVQRLRRAGVACRLDVFGDGPLRAFLAGEIERLGLAGSMTLHGAVPFLERLVPYLTDHADLFVCCHEQGDPACTYMETLGCGVPILGFANEAWRGMQQDLRVGWTVPAGDVGAMVAVASRLAADRGQLAAGAHAARDAATGHAFQATMDRRVAHLVECVAGAAEPAAVSSDAAARSDRFHAPAVASAPDRAADGAACNEEEALIVAAGHPGLAPWRRALTPPVAAALGLADDAIRWRLLCVPKPVADDPLKLLVCDAQRRRLAVVHCSAPRAPDMASRHLAGAQAAKRALGGALGAMILDPILQGEALGLTYTAFPYCRPLQVHGLAGRLNAALVGPALARWLRGVVQATASPRADRQPDQELHRALAHLESIPGASRRLREAARRAADDLDRGAWTARRVLMHGDLWLGNVLVRPARPGDAPPEPWLSRPWLPGLSWRDRLVLIDWPGSRLDGIPFFDLVRLAQSLRWSRRRLEAEIAYHCRVLECRRCDARWYVAAAMGELSLRLESFSPERFIALADSCWEWIDRGE